MLNYPYYRVTYDYELFPWRYHKAKILYVTRDETTKITTIRYNSVIEFLSKLKMFSRLSFKNRINRVILKHRLNSERYKTRQEKVEDILREINEVEQILAKGGLNEGTENS